MAVRCKLPAPRCSGRRETPCSMSGVGSGAAECYDQLAFPVACLRNGNNAADTFTANVATGCGRHLPDILGLGSMSTKRAMLVTEEGKQTLVLPGDGHYQLRCPSGTRAITAVPSKSGHLQGLCDEFLIDGRQETGMTQ